MEAATQAPRATRKHATVMFTDIVGFTALSERFGSEQAYGIVTGCLKLLDGIARKHGGSVDKYMGDSLMAVYGYPVPMEAQARAAVDAALEMRQAVYDYNRALALEVPLDVHIGVNTGPLVAGDIRGPVVREFHVLGDCVNVAARLKAKSPLGAIYVGPETHDASREHFVFETIEPLQLKGKSQRVPAYQVVSSREPVYAPALRPEQTVASGLVGRADELARLRGALQRLRAGRGGIVTLRGEPGSGKSRLLAELGNEPGLAGIRVVQVRPGLAREKRSLGLFAELVEGWAAESAAGEPADGSAQLAAALAERLPELADALRAPLTALLETAGGASGKRGAEREDVGRAVARLLTAWAEKQPLLFALDGLRHLDPDSLDLLERLLGLVETQPILFLLVGRSEEAATQHLLKCVSERHADRHEAIELGPLAPSEARQLIEAVAGEGGIGEVARALVEQRGAGNPARLLLGVFLAPALASESQHAEQSAERSSEAERRRATILFADITGFTAMTEKLGPETAYPIVAGCLQLLDEVARKNGGTVDKYMGDCVMALFGVPEAIEDAPRAAVNAAIEMRQRVRDYNREKALPMPLDVHTGIHTGLGIAGDISGPLLREFAVMGDPVDVASHLTDLAEAGQIFVGPETYRFTRERFDYRELGEVELKSGAQTFGSYELLSDRTQLHRERIGAERKVFSELVGREEELARLRSALAGLHEGRGAIASVVAEAGVGKSRLVAELRGSPEARGPVWLEGRSLSNGRQLSFHPFVDLCRTWAEIGDDDDDEAASAKFQAMVARLLPEEADRIFPFVASVMGLRLSEEQEEKLSRMQGEALEKVVRRSVTQLLRAQSETGPVVIVMDDLHWADQSSIELLEPLLGLAEEQGILFLNLCRPGFPGASGRVLDFVRENHASRAFEIALDPLDGRAARRLLGNLFKQGDIPHATRVMIEEKARGNPFYIEEVVRSLVDAGAVEYRDGGFVATDKIHSVQIPGTIQEVVMARVDGLGLEKKQVLQLASVVGQSFHEAVLEDVLGNAERLRERLRQLMDAEFLVSSDRTAGAEYAFKHPLVQEVTYDGLLQARREELHRGVACAIERRLPQDLPGFEGMLAYHFSMGRDVARAEEYLFRAGDEAAKAAGSGEALHFFRQASKLYFELHGDGGDPVKKAALQKNIARALYYRGQLMEAVEAFNDAMEFLGERVPRTQRGMALGFGRNMVSSLARLYLGGRRPAATEVQREIIDLMFQRALCEITADTNRFLFDSIALLAKLSQVQPATVSGSGAMYAASSVIFCWGGLSFGIGRRLLDVAESVVHEDDIREYILYRMMKFSHRWFEGDWDEAHEIPDALLQEGLSYGKTWDVLSYLLGHTDKRISMGDFEKARARIALNDQIWEEYQNDLAKSQHYYLTTCLLLEQRRLEEALGAVEDYYEENPEPLLHVHALGLKAKTQVLLGDLEGAETTLDKCAQIIHELGELTVPHYMRGQYRRSRLMLDLAHLERARSAGDAVAARRHRRRARRSGRQAVASAKWVAERKPEAYRLVGLYHWHAGHPERARRWWRRSIELGQQLGTRPELARTYVEVGRRLGAAERIPELDGIDASECFRRAQEIFQELGLDWDLARLAEIQAGGAEA